MSSQFYTTLAHIQTLKSMDIAWHVTDRNLPSSDTQKMQITLKRYAVFL